MPNDPSSWRLYVIVDRDAVGARDPAEVTAAAVRGGADAIQLRDKRSPDADVARAAQRLLAITRAAGVPLIINDRLEVACAVGADGLHLGQDDLPLAAARRRLGPGPLLGRSTHSLEQALAAQEQGADYLGVGPIFATPTKPDSPSVGVELIRGVAARVRAPLVCIGGIDRSTVASVLAAGARCVAVVRAVCAAQDPEAAARALKRQLAQFHRTTNASTL